MLKRTIQKIRAFRDSALDRQIQELITGLDWFLGIQDADPDTSNWGTGDFFLWVNNAVPGTKVIKYWNGAAVKTIATV